MAFRAIIVGFIKKSGFRPFFMSSYVFNQTLKFALTSRRNHELAWAHAIPAFFDPETLIDSLRNIRQEKKFPEKFRCPRESMTDTQ